MAKEDFTTYTESDPNSQITKTTNRVTFTGFQRKDNAYVVKDFGVDFFSGDFSSLITVFVSAHSAVNEIAGVWVMANEGALNLRALWTGNKNAIFLRFEQQAGVTKLAFYEFDVGNFIGGQSFNITLSTIYYIKITRDESVGSFGAAKCFIYTDAARTTLVATLTVTLNSAKRDYRYLYPLSCWGAGTTHSITGFTKDLEIETSIANLLQVSTQAMTVITATTATGNGTLDNLGISSVTAHGHVVGTTVDPKTAADGGSPVVEVDNGAGSLGVFTSNITGLLDGQKYYGRAYAKNTQGTVYGANVVFTASLGGGGTQLIPGNLSVVQNRLHWVGNDDGRERFFEGTLVP